MRTESRRGGRVGDGPRITIAAIAEQAGVSVPTVSKVLNGRNDVSAATRERVEKLLREGGYQRRRTAATDAVPMIDLVFRELDSPWALELIRGAEDAARAAGAEVVVSERGATRRPRQDWIHSVLNRQPAGVIMIFSDLAADQRAQLDARKIPYVVVDPVGEDDDSMPSVGSTNWNGGRAATRHLIELGHRRIATISGPVDTNCARARVAGYTDAMLRAKLSVEPELIIESDFTVEGGYAAAKRLLELAPRPTAIFAGSDLMALGVLRAIREAGLEVPADISVVGYDGLPLGEWVWPSLTTVEQPLYEMAAHATRMVLGLSRGDEPISRRVDLAVRLIERQSSGPVGSGRVGGGPVARAPE